MLRRFLEALRGILRDLYDDRIDPTRGEQAIRDLGRRRELFQSSEKAARQRDEWLDQLTMALALIGAILGLIVYGLYAYG